MSGCRPGAAAPAKYLPRWHSAMEQPPGTARHGTAPCAPTCSVVQAQPWAADAGTALGKCCRGVKPGSLGHPVPSSEHPPCPHPASRVGPAVVMATGSRAPSRCRSLSSRARRHSVRGWSGPLPTLQQREHPRPHTNARRERPGFYWAGFKDYKIRHSKVVIFSEGRVRRNGGDEGVTETQTPKMARCGSF